ncbi:hypothetical protein [Flindersiella endophytica]
MEPQKSEPYTREEMRAWLELLAKHLDDLGCAVIDDHPLPPNLTWPPPPTAPALTIDDPGGEAAVVSLWGYSVSGNGTSRPDKSFRQDFRLIVDNRAVTLSSGGDPDEAARRLRELPSIRKTGARDQPTP